MKIFVALAFVILALIVASACRSKKSITDTNTGSQIVWGSGGGITGKEVSFSITENGQIFKKQDMNSGFLEYASVKSKVAKAMFDAAKELNLNEISLNMPGNMYYFLEVPGADKPIRITWGDAQTEVPQKIKDFHVVLNQLLSKKASEKAN
jgi:hypothetical protein